MPSRIFPGRQSRPDWNNLNCLERNRFPRHAYFVHYPDQKTCENALSDNRRYLSPYVQLLNGTWDYKLFETVAQMPENIFAYRSGFDSISVPASYSISRLLNRKIQASDGWPFPINPPTIPENIPVGVYHRSVQFAKDWASLRKRLVFQGVLSAYHVVINGRMAGYAQQGLMTHEFDVTSLVHDGINEIFVLVYPYSAASYLDETSFDHRSGIVGDVYFEAVSTVSLFNLSHQTTQCEKNPGSWNLAIDATILSYRVAKENLHLHVALKKDDALLAYEEIPLDVLADAEGLDNPLPSSMPEPFDKAVQRVLRGSKTIQIDQVYPWSDESPELYDLYLTCADAAGREYGCVHQSIGFRELRQADGIWNMNGQPLKLFGIRYQPQMDIFPNHESLSHHVRELRLIRQQHLNAIFLSAIPIDPLFYELCNHLGLYVIQDLSVQNDTSQLLLQANDYSNKNDPRLSEKNQWNELIDQRIRSQSIINCNQSCLLGRIFPGDRSISQVDYPNQKQFEFSIDNQTLINDPSRSELIILDRQIDLTGGGPAGLSQMIDDVWANTDLSGVVCGRWDDVRAIVHSQKDKRFATSLSVLSEGIKPLIIRAIDLAKGQIELQSLKNFQEIDNLRIHWQILCNGLLTQAGEFDCPKLHPHQRTEVSINYGPIQFDEPSEYHLLITVRTISATLWQTADSVALKWDQSIKTTHETRDPYLKAIKPLISGQRQKLRLENDRHLLVISGPRFWIVFNRISGMLESWRCGDHEWLAFAQTTTAAHRGSFGPPAILWRPIVAQDKPYLAQWQQAGLDQLVQTVDFVSQTCDGTVAEITVNSRYGPVGQQPEIRVQTIYHVQDDGKITIQQDLMDSGSIDPELLPRFGFRLFLRKNYNRIIWSGQGPEPSWPNNRSMISQGQYSLPLENLMMASLPEPREYAPHDKTCWLACTDAKGNGLLIENDSRFSFQARDSVLEDLQEPILDSKQLHQNMIELCIDFHYKPAGVLHQTSFANAKDRVETGNRKGKILTGRITLTPSTGFPPV